MNMSQRPDSFEPGDYLEVLRRRWWIVLVLAVLGLLAAGAYVKAAPKVYTAYRVRVRHRDGSHYQPGVGRPHQRGDVNMDSQAQVVQSTTWPPSPGSAAQRPHRDAAEQEDQRHGPGQLADLQIACHVPSADAAATCAEAFAKAYLQSQSHRRDQPAQRPR